MTNRREFLKLGLAAMAVPAAGHREIAAAEVTRMPLSDRRLPRRLFYDGRFAACRRFAMLAGNDCPVSPLTGAGVARAWYEDLRPGSHSQPVLLAGLTGADTFFCLELMVRDQRMRTIWYIEHEITDRSGPRHVCPAAGGVPWVQALEEAGQNWIALLGEAITGQALQPHRWIHTNTASRQLRPGGSDRTLVSWVLAPAEPT